MASSLVFECASPTQNLHFSVIGKGLACGHSLCYNCYVNIMQKKCLYKEIKQYGCKHCGRVYDSFGNDRDGLTRKSKSKNGKVQTPSAETLCNAFLDEYKNVLSKVKDSEDLLNSRIDHIFDDIDTKVESLKCELDNLRDSIRNELTMKKDEITKKLIEKQNKAENDVKELTDCLEKSTELADDSFMKYETNINGLKSIYDTIDYEVSFEISDMQLDSSLVGRRLTANTLKQRFETKTFKSFEFNMCTKRVCALPNGTLLLIHSLESESLLSVYDGKTFKLRKTITELNNVSYEITGMATNHKDRIYLCDATGTYNVILMTDLELNFIKAYRDVNTTPVDIDFYNGHLYVCNPDGQCIVKFTEDLKFVKFFEIDSSPYRIRVLSHIACVISKGEVNFFDLNFDLIRLIFKYKLGVPFKQLNIFNNHFYLSCKSASRHDPTHNHQIFYCFTSTGDSYEIIQIEKPHKHLELKSFIDYNGCLLNTFLNDLNCNSYEDYQIYEDLSSYESAEDTYEEEYGSFAYTNRLNEDYYSSLDSDDN